LPLDRRDGQRAELSLITFVGASARRPGACCRLAGACSNLHRQIARRLLDEALQRAPDGVDPMTLAKR
jgi:hypothetical protein